MQHIDVSASQDCLDGLYTEAESMDDYLLGVYLTNFLWAHHAEICFRYEDSFLRRLRPCGHSLDRPRPRRLGAPGPKHLPDARARRVRHQPVLDPARVRPDARGRVRGPGAT